MINYIGFNGKHIEKISFKDNISIKETPALNNFQEWTGVDKFSIITGKNGCGKSQLLSYINILLNGSDQNIQFLYLPDFVINPYYCGKNNIIYKEEVKNFVLEFDLKTVPKFEPMHIRITGGLDTYKLELLLKNDDNFKNSSLNREEYFENELWKKISNNDYLRTTQSSKYEINRLDHLRDSVFNYENRKKDYIRNYEYQFINNFKKMHTFYLENISQNESEFIGMISNDEKRKKLIEEIFLKENPSIIDDINSEFEKYDFKFVKYDDSYTLCKRDKTGEFKEIDYTKLSSGEIVILNLISMKFDINEFTKNKPDIILLDEPDSHLDPKLTKIFFDVLHKVFHNDKDIQIIMTTHRPDTISLSPNENCSIFTIENNAPNQSIIRKRHKLEALFSLTHNIRDLYNFKIRIYVEGLDSIFYRGIYNTLLNFCNNLRNNDNKRGEFTNLIKNNRIGKIADPEYNHILSRRMQLSFVSSDGKTEVMKSVIRDDRSAKLDKSNQNIITPKLEAPFGLIDKDLSLLDEEINTFIKEQKLNQQQEPEIRDIIRKRISKILRHSKENFAYDPIHMLSLLDLQNLNPNQDFGSLIEQIQNIIHNYNTQSQSELQELVFKYFSLVLEEMINKDFKTCLQIYGWLNYCVLDDSSKESFNQNFKNLYQKNTDDFSSYLYNHLINGLNKKHNKFYYDIENNKNWSKISNKKDLSIDFLIEFCNIVVPNSIQKNNEKTKNLCKFLARNYTKNITYLNFSETNDIIENISIDYPQLFLDFNGKKFSTTIEELYKGSFSITNNEKNPMFDTYIENLNRHNDSAFIPIDLIETMFEINFRVRRQVLEIINPEKYNKFSINS